MDLIELLNQFQFFNTARDVTQLDEFMKLFIYSDELTIIGTAALN